MLPCKGLLGPGKSVYLTAGTYDVKSEKIALVQLQGCNYSIGEVSYYVNPDTGKIENGDSDWAYNDSTDFEAANWLSFDIYNRGLDYDDWYEVDVTAQNSGPVSIKEIGYSIDYLDAEGNVLYGGTGSFEGDIASMGSKRSETSFCDAIDGAGMTKKVVSTVITGYSYSLSSDDSNGYNYYSVDLVNNIAFGYHFDD